MRRRGRVSCLFGMGLLVATLGAGGALAAPGGNGKGHVGRGLALAKGHAKHPAAAPALPPQSGPAPAQAPPAQPAPAKPHPRSSPELRGNPAPPGAEIRHNHVTICHATGSGRYIVISPNVKGVLNGHLKHHDDFVYVDGCERPAEAPPPAVPPAEPPSTAAHPPRDPPNPVEATPPGGAVSGDLPFTGLPAQYLLLAGLALVASGFALRRPKPAR